VAPDFLFAESCCTLFLSSLPLTAPTELVVADHSPSSYNDNRPQNGTQVKGGRKMEYPSDLVEAAFRYGIIAPLLDLTVTRPERRLSKQKILSRPHDHPARGTIRISSRTLRRWMRAYRQHGLQGLCPRLREDRGPRILTRESLDYAEELIRENPRRDSEFLAGELEEKFPELFGRVKRSTLNRHLRIRGVDRSIVPPEDSSGPPYKAFEAASPNDLWHSDVHFGPPAITPHGQILITKIIAWLDDKSRVCCHIEGYFEEAILILEDSLKKGLQKFGFCKRTYSDRGSIYSSIQFSLICGDLGIVPILTRARAPWANGKIERFWRTLEDDLLSEIALLPPMPIAKLNRYLRAWVEADYHTRIHSELNEPPLHHWRTNVGPVIYPSQEQLQRLFWLWDRRTVSTTGAIQLFSNTYYVDPALACHKVIVRFDPHDLSIVHVWDSCRPRRFLCQATAIPPLTRPRVHPTPPKDKPKHSEAAQRRLRKLEERFQGHVDTTFGLIRFDNSQEVH
jgi:putative transposase